MEKITTYVKRDYHEYYRGYADYGYIDLYIEDCGDTWEAWLSSNGYALRMFTLGFRKKDKTLEEMFELDLEDYIDEFIEMIEED